MNAMDVLLKCVGVLWLVSWNNENVWIVCTETGPESYSLPIGNNYAQKPANLELSALFSAEGNTTNQVRRNGDIVLSGKNIAEKNTSHENIVNMEGGGGVALDEDFSHIDASSVHDRESLNSSISFNNSFSVDHYNRSSSVVPRKGVTFNKPKIVARKGVDSGTEENSSSVSGSNMESTGDNTEKNNDLLDKKCVCCFTSTLNVGTRNNSNYKCGKCCDVVKDEINTAIRVSNISNMTEPVNVLPADSPASAVNLTSQDSNWQNTSDSIKLDTHKSSSLYSTAASLIPHARNKKPPFTLDAANDLPANLSSQSLSQSKDLNRSDYVIPVILVIMSVPLVIVLALFLYKKGSEFWERRHYRRMDFLIDGMYNE